ncbi:glycosyltransferase [Cohnella sp. WQ 127256]|uniref:glycosyltransferase n=1 Tax=Cohnella sp. WQ 127256 TaxID=2938790 RepID=UPI0021196443|nr:glycosyltransferase [Cohnella sp. WQ 127256]
MVTISLCMIVKDEEATLDRVLSSVQEIMDEIIIVDTGSIDRTKEIARKYTDRIFDFKWIEDFSAARNFSFSKATKEYILWLDADDIVETEDRSRFHALKATLTPDIERVTMPYLLAFDTTGKPTSSLRRNRLVRRDRNFTWVGPVHEYLAAWGKFLDSDVSITHRKEKVYTDRNLRIYTQRKEAEEQFSIRDLYYYANELREHAKYDDAVVYYDKMLKTGQGWIEDNIQACVKMSECYSHMGNKEKCFESLVRALVYEKPRPDVSCAIAGYFFKEEQHENAVFWYDLATKVPPPSTMGMTNKSMSTWFPHLQMCLCYDRMGNYEKAYEHNEKALAFNPTHPSMLYNREYFLNVRKIGDTTA